MKLKKHLPNFLVFFLFFSVILVPTHNSKASIINSCGSGMRGIDIVFVFDNSSDITTSDPTNIRFSASHNLIDNLSELDRGAIITFNNEATNLQPLTSNRDLIKDALTNKVPSPTGGTEMNKGIQAALEEFEQNGGNNHKIMIVLSDGNSINNQDSLDLANDAYSNNITIYTIGLGEKSNVNVKALEAIATKTGGQYDYAVNAAYLTSIFNNIRLALEEIREPKVFSSWTFTDNVHIEKDLVLYENENIDLNGYNLTVDGDLVLMSCAELRAVNSGKISANNLEQKAGSSINLNNSQLEVTNTFVQDGKLRVNGDYRDTSIEEIFINGNYEQKIHGQLDLNGYKLKVNGNLTQEGFIDAGGGTIQVSSSVRQKGSFDVNKGTLTVGENLYINGGPLVDDNFLENKSLNVNRGSIQVNGDAIQDSGQLYVNYGLVEIFGDYHIKDGWLTMIHGTSDTSSAPTQDSMILPDGDYVHVYRNFTMESPRNHSERIYSYLGEPMNDQNHLTDGILQVDGDFTQLGDGQNHTSYSDRSQEYTKDYSRYNFAATGRHKVLLTGDGKIEMHGTGSHFNILEINQLEGHLNDFQNRLVGQVRWNQLIENHKAANANLTSLSINDVPVWNFNSNVLNYDNHVISSDGVTEPLRTLKVDARPEDRNAKVDITGNTVASDGTAQVKILVTAHDGTKTNLYTVNVIMGGTDPNRVTSIELDQAKLSFLKEGSNFTPSQATIRSTVYPKNAENQGVIWSSTNLSVAEVDQNGIVTPKGEGKTTIVAETVDGGFTATAVVEVTLPYDLLEGIDTLADLVSDNNRYDKIMALYDLNKIGVVVPGEYIHDMNFSTSGSLVQGTITVDTIVDRVDVRVNSSQLNVYKKSASTVPGTEQFLFTRSGLIYGDYIEVIAYNIAGDEVERIATVYPVSYTRNTTIPYGFYSIENLLTNPFVFNQILDQYPLEELRFVHQ